MNQQIGNGKYRCGCSANVEPSGNLYISWCNTHEQAPAMLAVLTWASQKLQPDSGIRYVRETAQRILDVINRKGDG